MARPPVAVSCDGGMCRTRGVPRRLVTGLSRMWWRCFTRRWDYCLVPIPPVDVFQAVVEEHRRIVSELSRIAGANPWAGPGLSILYKYALAKPPFLYDVALAVAVTYLVEKGWHTTPPRGTYMLNTRHAVEHKRDGLLVRYPGGSKHLPYGYVAVFAASIAEALHEPGIVSTLRAPRAIICDSLRRLQYFTWRTSAPMVAERWKC